MTADRKKSGLTLVEVMVVVLIIAVAVIGAMGFRFYCVRDAKLSDVQANAARIGSMILDNWKARGGDASYNPYTHFATFSSQLNIPKANDKAVGNAGNTYQIQDVANSVWYDVALSTAPVTYTSTTGGITITLTALKASISWRQGYLNSGTTMHTINMATYAD
jgi:prepilin-type N-terminal cleavage/methylation domain-containing protein